MATFVEKINEDSEYTKLVNVLKECFEDGHILNKQLLIEQYMKHYSLTDIGEANKVVKDEFDRIITNLATYSKVRQLSNGQYVLRLKKTSREERRHEQKEMSI